MAITIIDEPVLVQTAYNPIYTKVSSNQTSQEAFNFLFDTYVNGVFVNRDRLLPRPGTTQAIYSPARILESYLSYDLSQNVIADTASSNCIDQYKVVCGEEYIVYWEFDNIVADTFTSTSYSVFYSNTEDHSFQVGDDILIAQDPGFVYSHYNGVYKVVDVIDSKTILVNVTFQVELNRIQNGTFANTSIWDTNGLWTISGGNAHCTSSNEASLAQSSIFTPGEDYYVSINVIALTGTMTVAIGAGTLHTITTTGTHTFTLTNVTGDDFEVYVSTGGSATVDNIVSYRVVTSTGRVTFSDKRKTQFIGQGDELMLNPHFQYLGGTNYWTTDSHPGCSSSFGISVANKMQLVIPDISCADTFYSSYTGGSFTPGISYDISITVDTINNPSGNGQNITIDLGGTLSTAFVGVGTFNATVICGTSGDLRLIAYMDADTGGFGSHSFSLTNISIKESEVKVEGYDFNGVLQYEQIPTWDYTDFYLDGPTKRFLTNQPETVLTRLNERGSIGFMNLGDINDNPAYEYYMVVGGYNLDGSLRIPFIVQILNMSTQPITNNRIIEFPAYPWNLNQLSQDLLAIDVIDSTTSKYTLQIYVRPDPIGDPGVYLPISELKTFELDLTCSKFEPVRFMFLNSLGQFDYYTATLLSRTTINTTKDYFVKTLPLGYSVGDRGKTAINTNAQETYVVNTDWISEETARWLSYELYNSIEIYTLDSDGVITPIVLDTASIEVKKRVNDKLLNYSFNYSKAVPLNNQRN